MLRRATVVGGRLSGLACAALLPRTHTERKRPDDETPCVSDETRTRARRVAVVGVGFARPKAMSQIWVNFKKLEMVQALGASVVFTDRDAGALAPRPRGRGLFLFGCSSARAPARSPSLSLGS